MSILTDLVGSANEALWGFALLFLLGGTGVYFTVRLRFVQVRKLGEGFRRLFGGLHLGRKKPEGEEGSMSSFQSLMTAIAAQVGTGNLAGAATALILGGPGAIFWMWVAAFFGMATIFAEAVLAQRTKQTEEGEVIGGPAFYIRRAFKGRFGKLLAGAFSVLCILALGFAGNMVQSNSIGDAFAGAFGVPPILTGIVVALAAGLVLLGGTKRVAHVTEKIVPVMALFYIAGALAVILANAAKIPGAFAQIFTGAFSPQSLGGAAVGITVQKALRYGAARGIFSNEAGMGSTPHAHALARVKDPCEQGVVAMLGVFIDTFVILTLTALVVLTSGVLAPGALPAETQGVGVVQAAFTTLFGSFGGVFIAICMLFFAFSTILGWTFFGELNIRYLFGKKAVKFYLAAVLGFILLGSALKVEFVWSLADLFNGLMTIPNLLAVLALSAVVARALRGYEKK